MKSHFAIPNFCVLNFLLQNLAWISIWGLVSAWLLNFLCKLCSFLEFFSHILLNGAVANEVEFKHGLFDRDGIFGAHTKSWELEIPEWN